MKLLFRYIYDRISQVILFAVSCIIFMVVFMLYDIKTEAIIYASAVSALVMLIFFTVRFSIYAARYHKAKLISDELGCIIEDLPEPHDLVESKYLEAISLLRDKISKTELSAQNSKTEMLDYFTTWVHQIKIPISVMRMELVEQDTDEYRELSAELFRIEQYVEMVLCYFRLEDGGKDLVVKETELDPVIRANVRKYAPIFIRKRIMLIFEGTDQKAVTDSKWLDFILGQLLSNSLKYTKQGSVSIIVGGDSITVSDTGIGISEEDLPRIFERGYTGINGRTENRSTGIGLYLVKKAADRIGAVLSVKSKIGKGTDVCISFPAEKIKE